MTTDLPTGWSMRTIAAVAEVNPRRPSQLRELQDQHPVTFVPMPAVSEVSGTIASPETRPFGEVKRGFTYFAEGDVIFAKITPCMQNGKSAIARGLSNDLGFGSTEFHVLRPKPDSVCAEWLWYFVRNPALREEATYHFQGAVGQQRVPLEFLAEHLIPVPPLAEQVRIVSRIRDLMERVDEIGDLRARAASDADALSVATLGDAERGLTAPRVPLGELLLESRNGRSIKSSGDVGNGSILTLAAVRSTIVDLEQCKPVVLDDATAAQFMVRRGDVFISRANTIELVGLAAIVGHNPPARLIFPDLLIRLRPNARRVTSKYLAYSLRFPGSRKQIKERAVGSSQSMVKISGERLREVTIPVPDIDAQNRVVSRLERLLKIRTNIQQKMSAESGKDARLPTAILRKAFAGEL